MGASHRGQACREIWAPNGLTLMWHAVQGGPDAAPVVQHLTGLGDADVSPPTVPLDVADRATLVGKYPYGPGTPATTSPSRCGATCWAATS